MLRHVDVYEAENAQLKKKINFCNLRLRFSRMFDKNRIENDVLVLNDLEPPPDLEYLEIYGYWSTKMYPDWTMFLAKLKMLKLTRINLKCLPPLRKLLLLESLEIQQTFSLKKVGVEFLEIDSNNNKDTGLASSLVLFPNLKSLKFVLSKKWEEWTRVGGMKEDGVTIMSRLHFLTINCCHKLKSLPNFLQTIPLKELEIITSPIISKCYQRGTGEEWSKIWHIPNIKIDYAYVQIDGCDPSVRVDNDEVFASEVVF